MKSALVIVVVLAVAMAAVAEINVREGLFRAENQHLFRGEKAARHVAGRAAGCQGCDYTDQFGFSTTEDITCYDYYGTDDCNSGDFDASGHLSISEKWIFEDNGDFSYVGHESLSLTIKYPGGKNSDSGHCSVKIHGTYSLEDCILTYTYKDSDCSISGSSVCKSSYECVGDTYTVPIDFTDTDCNTVEFSGAYAPYTRGGFASVLSASLALVAGAVAAAMAF